MNNKILKSVKSLANGECANYRRGNCLETQERCHVINDSYNTIHEGAVDCDYFMEAVLPVDWDLNDMVAYALWYNEGDRQDICSK